MSTEAIEQAKEHFGKLLEQQLQRVERMKAAEDWIDYSALDTIIIGCCGGDGIGPTITAAARRALEFLLADELASGKVEIRDIEGLTIENRAAKMQSIPDDVLAELRKCHVILKGPTLTPSKGDEWPNIESANVSMRRELDLFANVRPVRVPSEGLDWMFFRENTEGAYILGSQGVNVGPDLAIDFKAITTQGSERIIRLAFEEAKKRGDDKVTVVTKANVVKTSDGKFLEVAECVAEDYPGIAVDSWFVDIMTAKLVDPKRRTSFHVMVLPNLYGDIITDEAAEFQGGVGTAGSANIGKRYAMFEAIHGTGDKMVREGRDIYADPSSITRAGAFLLRHIGLTEKGDRLEMALDVCGQYEKKLEVTGRDTGCTGQEFAEYLMETVADPELESKWKGYQ
ncbi:MAG: isocitrate/isopropylmalate family dehydrogenase [Armatimonadota bacterium]